MAKYVFIAGGIGITPFRSMMQELVLQKKVVDITLLYQVSTQEDVLFKNVLQEAQQNLGLKVQYFFSSQNQHITQNVLEKFLHENEQPLFYISGPQGFVLHAQELLYSLQVPIERIKTDLFTGYA